MPLIRRQIILWILVLCLAATTGCNSLEWTVKRGQYESTLAEIFRSSGEALVASLKRLLRNVEGDDALDVQTAITLETVRIPADQVADRRQFQDEANNLNKLIAEARGETPIDSAVLAYLANLANGQSASASYLSESQEEAVLKLCGPAHEVIAHTRDQGETTSERLLRQSCFTWLVGDSEKSNALYYLAITSDGNTAEGAENGFEAFLHRLELATGISLLAHRARLQKLPHQGYATTTRDTAPGTVERHYWLSTSVDGP